MTARDEGRLVNVTIALAVLAELLPLPEGAEVVAVGQDERNILSGEATLTVAAPDLPALPCGAAVPRRMIVVQNDYIKQVKFLRWQE